MNDLIKISFWIFFIFSSAFNGFTGTVRDYSFSRDHQLVFLKANDLKSNIKVDLIEFYKVQFLPNISLPILNITSTPSPVSFPRPEATVLEQASCRYGPGFAYLFEWGLYPGDFVWLINRNQDGSWLYVKPITYNNECWVKADLLEIRGEVMDLSIFYSELPKGYLYKPVHYVVTRRAGNNIIIQWEPVWMTEDDDRGYLIESWICRKGLLTFEATSIFPYSSTYLEILDEPGCRNASYGRIYAVEKHGYMPSVHIPWPKPLVNLAN